MQLFRKLFNPFNKPERGFPADAQRETLVADKMLANMFRLDLHHLSLHDFIEGKIEVNANGALIQTYSKALDYKECGIFDIVLVKLAGNQSFNIIFRCSEPDKLDDSKLRKVVDDLCEIYGQNSNGSVPYETSVSDNAEQQVYVPFGRDWMDYPKYKYPLSVRRYTEDVFISIWGFRLQETITDK
jgi:hypothetical protein